MEVAEYKAVTEAIAGAFFTELKKFLLEINEEQEKKQKEMLDHVTRLKEMLKGG